MEFFREKGVRVNREYVAYWILSLWMRFKHEVWNIYEEETQGRDVEGTQGRGRVDAIRACVLERIQG